MDLQDFDGNSWYANYKTFRIGDEASNYMLHIHNYNGTAGNLSIYELQYTFICFLDQSNFSAYLLYYFADPYILT